MSDLRPKTSLAADASWLTLAKTLAYAVTFIVPLIMVRHLSQRDFGVYRQLSLLISTAIVVLPSGFAMSAFYFLPRAGTSARSVATNILLVYVAVCSIASGILLFDPGVLAAIFHDPSLTPYARLVAAVLFAGVVSSFVDLLALAKGDVRTATIFLVITSSVKAILLSAAALRFSSVRPILVALTIHGLLQLGIMLFYVRREFGSLTGRVDFPLLWRQVMYAVPLGLAGWLSWLQTDAHHYFVARAFGSATYAIYSVGCVIVPLAGVFGESMAFVAIRRVSELHSENRRGDVILLLSQVFRNLAAVYLPLYVLLLLVGRDLIAVVYTPRFIDSWPIFAINLTLMPMSILAVISDAVFRSYSRCRPFLVGVRMVLVTVLLAGLWYATPRYGPLATVSIVVAVNIVERLIIAGRTASVLELHWRDAVLLKGVIGIIVTVLLAAVATILARSALGGSEHLRALVVSGFVFGVVYVGSNLVRFIASGQELPLDALPEPLRRAVVSVVSRARRNRRTHEAEERAA